MDKPVSINLAALEWTPHPSIEGVQSKFFQNTSPHSPADMLLAQVQVGGEIPWHQHPEESEIAYVLQGSAKLLYAFSEVRAEIFEAPMQMGSALIIPAGVWHSVINLGETPLLAFAVHSK